jgi:hypothetical protein
MKRKDVLPDFVRDALGDSPKTLAGDAEQLEPVLLALAESAGSETPPPALRKRLLSAATAGPMRFAPFFDGLGRLFDLGQDAVVRVLERADSESEWEPGPHPAVRLLHLTGGPSLAAADAGLVRMPPSFAWGAHRHHAAERVLILEGGYRDSEGRVHRAGDLHEMGAGTEHGFTVLPDGPLLFALVLHGKIEMI